MIKRILIIDNDSDVLDIFQEIFYEDGFEVKTLTNTENIFADISSYNPDIIMIDYILEGINGGEICHQIKSNKNTCSLPVIIISAYTKVINSLGYYGCDKFIAKPFDIYDVIEQVKQLLDHSKKNLIISG